ncbi:hypothetical protein E5Z02_14570 [Streptomyces rhizosphaericola]|uniref:Transposase n=1 Tax=Streptomyces rhizosphaericola TaxID=2564098 RepID=A0ABY2PEY6_9ACTN|nr:hypothetical protein E5Z02_14570 [Streptomyces rhizosphaericola]
MMSTASSTWSRTRKSSFSRLVITTEPACDGRGLHRPALGVPGHRREHQRLHPARGDHGPQSHPVVRSARARPARIAATIPERIDQINGRLRRGESRCRLDRAACRRGSVVERCFNRLNRNNALATRHDERARYDQTLVTIACLRLWLP